MVDQRRKELVPWVSAVDHLPGAGQPTERPVVAEDAVQRSAGTIDGVAVEYVHEKLPGQGNTRLSLVTQRYDFFGTPYWEQVLVPAAVTDSVRAAAESHRAKMAEEALVAEKQARIDALETFILDNGLVVP